jgi:hypothetical protein
VAEAAKSSDASVPGKDADTDADKELITNHSAPKGWTQEDSERDPEREMGGNEPVEDDETSADKLINNGEAEDLAKAMLSWAASAMAGVDDCMLDQEKVKEADGTLTVGDSTYAPFAEIASDGEFAALNKGAYTVTVNVVDSVHPAGST